MAACWRCGTKTPVDANFCPNCGAEIRAQVRELDVFAEPTGHAEPVEAATSSSPRWLIVGALAVLGGLIAFYALTGTTDEPSADPSDSNSTDGSDEPATSDDPDERDEVTDVAEPTEDRDDTTPETSLVGSIDWTATFEATGFPRAAIEIDGSTFLFVSDAAFGWQGGGSARAFERAADGQWREAGPVGEDDAAINAFGATEDGAIATGSDRDGNPTVWWTSDGTTWEAESLPPPDDSLAGTQPGLVVSTSGTTMVLGATVDPWTALHEAVAERYADVGGPTSIEWNGPGSAVTVRGPFGIVLDTIAVDDPDLQDLDLRSAFDRPESVPTWVHDGAGWTVGDVVGPYSQLLAVADRIVRVQDDVRGLEYFNFDDGGWSEPTSTGFVWGLHAWGDRLIAGDNSGDLAFYSDEFAPESPLALPSQNSMGDITGLSAGNAGLMVLESVWQPDAGTPPDDNERIVVLRDGYTLDVSDAELRLTQGEEILIRSSRFWNGTSDHYAVDLTTAPAEVTFLSDEGAALVTFTVAELTELQTATESSWWGNDQHQHLWFTSDTTTWFGGTVDAQATWFIQPHVLDDLLMATIVDSPTAGWDPFSHDFQFRILEAPIPG